ncbi:STAS domain-containing protein [Haloactinomyces albus]|uniref:Anti-sigma factor antagonist n=1 Tax=Haloactinomyces albus TaxID=1352928 RepID=A0AAE3ZF25_9ACTN|nr:STAS domain-containing protein [Haloactinomyces albus]MDR7302700.1 anti-anti-sigma factor [Haloactinomyces albus]
MPTAPLAHLSTVEHVREHTTAETRRLSCRVQEDASRVLLHLRGELDLLGAPKLARVLQECLAATDGKAVVCDLSGLDFLATSGLQVFFEADEHARAQQRELVLLTAGSATEVLRLLEVTDTHSALTCRNELAEVGTPVLATT